MKKEGEREEEAGRTDVGVIDPPETSARFVDNEFEIEIGVVEHELLQPAIKGSSKYLKMMKMTTTAGKEVESNIYLHKS